MDEGTVKAHLNELRERLELVDQERAVIIDLIRGYEGWLRLRDGSPHQLKMVPPKGRGGRPKKGMGSLVNGRLSIRAAVMKVLQDAHGGPIHSKEILARIGAMGVSPEAKQPIAVIDLTCYSMMKSGGKPIERIAPRTWRWTDN